MSTVLIDCNFMMIIVIKTKTFVCVSPCVSVSFVLFFLTIRKDEIIGEKGQSCRCDRQGPVPLETDIGSCPLISPPNQ
ncbi:hypothetical protein BDW42DRAFT_173982 [Aspergillus taichungensis]|uniref:Uncharacterized protein n=1 Tax=Aspergillus taichungensis TaxID=482145 RepID=A0A2J5HP23_9EURO|nr:hypothetical protein BDW42DRAFT_173982 [Aspergillus taichungensis]